MVHNSTLQIIMIFRIADIVLKRKIQIIRDHTAILVIASVGSLK